MENKLLTLLAAFILICGAALLIVGYATLWTLYPTVALILTLLVVLYGVCMLYCKMVENHDEELKIKS